MTIGEIYDALRIPPNLREHMLRVCGIVTFIEKHWIGVPVDWEFTKKLALLHDVGNIVKFDLNTYPHYLGNEEQNAEHWKNVQKEIITKYGSDDHVVTTKMLREMGVEEKIIETILKKSFANSVETAKSNDWPLKILYYGDFRTLPLEIGSLEERIQDVRDRMPWYARRPDIEELVNACRDIEKQIQDRLNISVFEINDSIVSVDYSSLELDVF